MKRTLLSTIAAALLGADPFATSTSAQIPISAGPYSQNFNSLASSGTANAWVDGTTLPGWYASTNKSVSAQGPITVYRADTGTGNTGALYSYGAASSSERALGSVCSGTPVNIAYGVRFANDLSEAVTNITITYTGEQWRNSGAAAAQTLAFSYRISDTPITSSDAANVNTWTPFAALDFSSPIVGGTSGALDGNAPANQRVFSAVPLTGITVLPGQEVFLRWVDKDDSGSDHGLAIDDLMVAFNASITLTNPAVILPGGQPQSRTNNAGTTATFTVSADGSPTLHYQWRKDGLVLTDSAGVFGSSSPTLALSNVFAADAGSYDVVVSNSVNATTSAVATLTVIDPVIYRQPVSRSVFAGDTVTFNIGAAGTPTLAYQWLFGGSPIADATASSLTLTDVHSGSQGSYACVFTGALGVLTSAVATLTVTTLPDVTLALWDFNDTNAPTASPPPFWALALPASSTAFHGALASGASADTAGTNRAWNISSYPAQGTANKQSGVQFSVSTVGYKGVLVAWYQRHSNTASKYQRFQYTINGADFVDQDVIAYTVTDNSFVFYSVDLSGITGGGRQSPICVSRGRRMGKHRYRWHQQQLRRHHQLRSRRQRRHHPL